MSEAVHSNSTSAPGIPPDAINRPTVARLRAEISARVERLISALDMIDNDPDREEDDAPEDGNDTELCLGWNEGARQDRLGSPCEDGEWSLGWKNEGAQVGGRLHASADDRKLDIDTDEGDTLDEHGEHDPSDEEPALGWPNTPAMGCATIDPMIAKDPDGEAELVNEDGSDTGPSDNGIAVQDGTAEQYCGRRPFGMVAQ